ncbi:MAG TPA: hypothetical protein VLV30_00105, partial [Methanomicrobiales archaeon]|nr:hypothetical protein [Methanomicrobiales archaeon]
RDLFTGMGGFLPHLTWNEDLELWLRVALKYPVAFSWRGPGLWHLEAANRVSNSLSYRDIERRGEFVERAADAIRSPDTPSRHLPCLKEYIAKFELARALWIIEAGHPGEARRILSAQHTALFPKKRRQYLLLSFVPAPLFRGLWRLYRGIHEHVKGEQYNENPWLR